MLPKGVDWYTLAQCDYFVVDNFVRSEDRPAMRTIAPMNEGVFKRKLTKETKWKETYEAVKDSYQKLDPNFKISHDRFGGYRLVYTGKSAANPPTVFKKVPVGFVIAVPENAVTNLSIMSSERTGGQLLLLGPIRFVNSDCQPNCEYDFSSDLGIVQLRVKQKINPGDEIFVKYGPNFFEHNACLCRSCDIRKKTEKRNEDLFNNLVDFYVEEIVQVVIEEEQNVQVGIEEEQNRSPDFVTTNNFAKRRRLRRKDLVEIINEITSSPLSNQSSPCDRHCPELLNSPILSQDFLISPETTDGSDSSIFETDEECTSQSVFSLSVMPVQNCQESNVLLPILNEVQDNHPEHCATPPSLSDQGEDIQNALIPDNLSDQGEHSPNALILDDGCTPELFSKMLFDGSSLSVENAVALTDLFCSRFSLSDECSTTLHALIKSLLPAENNFPSSSSYVRKIKKAFEEELRLLRKTENHSFCVLSFRDQLRNVIKKHLDTIFGYASKRREKPNADFNNEFCPPVANVHNKVTFNLLLFSDGVNIKKSTMKKELWPVWIQIADLPPRLRMSRDNIVLAALYVGGGYPNWKEIAPELKGELLSGVEISGNGQFFRAFFKIKLLISDLGAKSHMLNMIKFNGYFGCHFCTAEGKTIGKTHAYYPFEQSGQIREKRINDAYVECAEIVGFEESVNVVGVKGSSAFSDIIEGLPLTAPVDYMHCVLIGVFPDLLKLCVKSLSTDEKIRLNVVISNLSCPREMIAYSRKIRPLDELPQFKANEYFNWLFYLSPIFFQNRLPNELFSHLSNLVFGIRLLLESSSESNVQTASKCLDDFCKEIVTIHDGNERIETINVHSIRHFADQVRMFGPLYCYSAMSFEAANRSLGDVFTGSHSECEVICRRVLQRHKLTETKINEPYLQSLCGKLGIEHGIIEDRFDDGFLETNSLNFGKLHYPQAKFFNRQTVGSVYFDSCCYKRSKLGNCFVSFVKKDKEMFGQIEYFLQLNGPPFHDQMLAVVTEFDVLEDFGLIKGFFHRVARTTKEHLIPVVSLTKVFFMTDFSPQTPNLLATSYMVKLCCGFEHS